MMHSNTLNTLIKFVNNRVIELLGIILVVCSIYLLLAIITYSPNDPTFIYSPENKIINNLFGLKGSIVSDFLLQSIGLLSFLFIINFLVWGIKLTSKKIIKNFLSKIFFLVIYILSGTTLIYLFNNNSFWLIDNGNSGFVGRIIVETFNNILVIHNNIYISILLLVFTLMFFFSEH